MALWMPMQEIVPLLVICSLVINLMMLSALFRHVKLKLISVLLIGGFFGIPVGIWLLGWLPGSYLKQIAGLLIILLSLFLFSGKRLHLKAPQRFYLPIGFVSGIMQGSLSLSGPPLVLFFSNEGIDKQSFRASLTAYFTAINVLTLPGFMLSGALNQAVWHASVLTLPGMMIGIWLGMRVANKLPEITFKKISLGLMAIAGVMALVSG